MPTRYDVDPGGEWLLPFAKKKLAQLKTHIAGLGLGSGAHRRSLQVDESTRIEIMTCAGFDEISIRAGAAVWWTLSGEIPSSASAHRTDYSGRTLATVALPAVEGVFASLTFAYSAELVVTVGARVTGVGSREFVFEWSDLPGTEFSATLSGESIGLGFPKLSTDGTRAVLVFSPVVEVFRFDRGESSVSATRIFSETEFASSYEWNEGAQIRYSSDQSAVVMSASTTVAADSALVVAVDIATGVERFRFSGFINRLYSGGAAGVGGYSALQPQVYYDGGDTPWVVLLGTPTGDFPLSDGYVYHGDTLALALQQMAFRFPEPRWAVATDSTFVVVSVDGGDSTVHVLRGGLVIAEFLLAGDTSVSPLWVSRDGTAVLLDRAAAFLWVEFRDGVWTSYDVARTSEFAAAWDDREISAPLAASCRTFVFSSTGNTVWQGGIVETSAAEQAAGEPAFKLNYQGPFDLAVGGSFVAEAIQNAVRW